MLSGFLKISATEIKPIRWVPLSGAIAFVLWGPCWFGATAVLAWDRTRQRHEAERVKTVEVARVSADDLRALREARMPGREQS
jgi:hypothetical protein